MFEKLLKERLRKLRRLFGETNVEAELLPLRGEEVKIKKKREED